MGVVGRRSNLLHPQGRLGRRSYLEKEKSGSASAQEQTILLDNCTSVSWGETGLLVSNFQHILEDMIILFPLAIYCP